MNASIKFAHSEHVNDVRASCVTRRCRVREGMTRLLRRGGTIGSDRGRSSSGTMPGVLFRVVRRCSLGVFFSALFAVGFRASIVEGAFVILGIVKMGVSSITLCSSSRAVSFTLCLSTAGVGVKMLSIRLRRRLSKRRPLVVAPAGCAHSVSSSVSAQKCWWASMSGS